MTNRSRILIIVFLAGSLALVFWSATGPQEPVFEGRSLSSWLDHHVASSAASPPYNSPGWKKADEAIRAIGTNGIPTLVKMIGARDLPQPLLKLVRASQRYRWTYINYRSRIGENEEAEYAFGMLRANALSAVPELIKIYEQNISSSSQRCAASALGSIASGARAALPALIRNFKHTNGEVRFYAVSAVMLIGGETNVIFPALTSALKDANVNVRWNALVGLERFGSRARPVVPEIEKMLNDPGMVGTSSITQAVQTALWRIAPEKVGKALVVEPATSIITNGVTSQAVKFLFYGKRQTLIPAGKPVPVLGQYWNSDPRPRLTMYRGASAADGEDHLVGEFEVMDVPPSVNVNISTLCVIADGQIVLCARDNTRDVFLEIRRVENNGTK